MSRKVQNFLDQINKSAGLAASKEPEVINIGSEVCLEWWSTTKNKKLAFYINSYGPIGWFKSWINEENVVVVESGDYVNNSTLNNLFRWLYGNS